MRINNRSNCLLFLIKKQKKTKNLQYLFVLRTQSELLCDDAMLYSKIHYYEAVLIQIVYLNCMRLGSFFQGKIGAFPAPYKLHK